MLFSWLEACIHRVSRATKKIFAGCTMDPTHSLLDKNFPALLQVVLFSLAIVGAVSECVPSFPLLGNHGILWKKKISFPSYRFFLQL